MGYVRDLGFRLLIKHDEGAQHYWSFVSFGCDAHLRTKNTHTNLFFTSKHFTYNFTNNQYEDNKDYLIKNLSI